MHGGDIEVLFCMLAGICSDHLFGGGGLHAPGVQLQWRHRCRRDNLSKNRDCPAFVPILPKGRLPYPFTTQRSN
eukprot:scaffold46851_cov20-Prasinocladus_malaysianus.AAC.1